MDKFTCLKAANAFHRSLEKMLERDLIVFKNEIEPSLKICHGIISALSGAWSKWGPRKLEATSGIITEIETMLARLNAKMDEFDDHYSEMQMLHELATIAIKKPKNMWVLLPREMMEWIIKTKSDIILKRYKTSKVGSSDFPKRVMEFRKECVDGINLVKSVSCGFLTEEPKREDMD